MTATTFLDASRFAVLRAAVDRLIPADEDPGGLDVGADVFVDRLLGDPSLSPSVPEWRRLYDAGLEALDAGARGAYGVGFAEAAPEQRDEVLAAEAHAGFVALLRTHAIFGFLCDPRHGGNRDGLGWRFYGHPAYEAG